MEIRYTHDHLDAEILARTPPSLTLRSLAALISGILLFPMGFCGAFVIGGSVAGILEAVGWAEDIPLSAGLLFLFITVGAVTAATTMALQIWALWRDWCACRYRLSVDTRTVRLLHDRVSQSWPLAGMRAAIDGTDLLLLPPLEQPAVRIPMGLCSESDRTLLRESINAAPPQLQPVASLPPELLSLKAAVAAGVRGAS